MDKSLQSIPNVKLYGRRWDHHGIIRFKFLNLRRSMQQLQRVHGNLVRKRLVPVNSVNVLILLS